MSQVRLVALTFLVIRGAACLAQVAAGAAVSGPPRVDSVAIVPGPHHDAGSFGRFVFGQHYRDLWTTRLTLPVLSLDTFATGLRPLRRGGSHQTLSLHLQGADGRHFVFRSVQKDASLGLPVELRGTYVDRIAQDLLNAALFGGPLIVASLLDATGVLHVTPQLVVMPDDPRLGEFRADFAGMLGLLEERPQGPADDDDDAAFAGAQSVVSSEKLFEHITSDGDEQVDARVFLAARLFDVFVGDWDRHPDQWRWARFGGDAKDRWYPIPRDRDWAFARLDGLMWGLVRTAYPWPQFVNFERIYPDLVWLTWTGRRLDRRLLSGLERPVWDSVALALRDQMSDEVIDRAIDRLPGSLARDVGIVKLRASMRARRDSLPAAARAFYAVLADEVDVHGTDGDEVVEVAREVRNVTTVTIRQRRKSGAPRARVWLERHFDGAETREIRLYLHKGDDSIIVRGVAPTSVVVRVVGDGKKNVYVDSSTSPQRVRYYDRNPASVVEGAGGLHDIDRRGYKEPKTRRGWIDPPRDWGERWRPLPWVSYAPIVGLFVGGGPLYKRYGFRDHPYSYSTSFLAGYATGANRFRAQLTTDVRRSNSDVHASLVARYSGIDIVRFYGYGNATARSGSDRFHAVDQRVLSVEPMVYFPLATDLEVHAGAGVRYTRTETSDNNFIATSAPYGVGAFGQVGMRGGVAYDTRDFPDNATTGILLSADAAHYPDLWSARGTFGALRSTVSTYLHGGGHLQPVLALRASGEKLWGRVPFSDAAFIGGASTVRGLAEQRFAGSASLVGNAELRVFLTKMFLLLPADVGAFGLSDAGRVYAAGDDSNSWHQGYGGGIWVSLLGRQNTFSVAMARSREGRGFYFRSGMMF